MRKSRVKAEGEHVHRDSDDDPKVTVTKGKARMTATKEESPTASNSHFMFTLTQAVSTFQLLFNKWRINLVFSSPSARERNGIERWFTSCGSCPTHPAY